MKLVIIGAGPAGITVAEQVRAADPSARIAMLSTEAYPPYSPPAMAEHFLSGRDEPLFWKGLDVCERLDLDWHPSTSAVSVDVAAQLVHCDGGRALPFDQLVIASGSRLHSPVTGWDLPGVLDFKSLSAAERIVSAVRRGETKSAVIVGAGFIGMEIALLLADLGVQVTIVGRRGWLMPRMLDPETAGLAQAQMEARGVRMRLGVEAKAFLGTAAAEGVELANGEILRADLFVAATGVKPNVGFLQGSGITAAWGITVDDQLRTTAPGVWAAGDAVEARDRFTGEAYVHAIFPNAVEQARVVAENLLGFPTRYDGAESMNSLKHLGLQMVAAGTDEGADEIRIRTADVLRKVYVREGRVVGFRLAGDIRGAGILHALMLRREDVRRFGRRIVEPRFGLADQVSGTRVAG